MPPAPRLRFLGYEESRQVPNLVVDGSPNESTVLTLTHWPGIAQPPGLGADLSAEMAYLYLEAPAAHPPAEVVTNNHFDQDGLVSLHALVEPDAARRHRDLLVEVARAGDFGTYRSPDAARASMAIAAYADEERSPLAHELTGLEYPDQCRLLYEATLPLLVAMATEPERFRQLWAEEDDRLTASEAAIASGEVTVAEHPEVDLAVVTIDAAQPSRSGHRFASERLDEIHPFAINRATDRLRLLIVHGSHYRYVDRYETWVQYRSRPVPQRVDLAALATALSDLDGSASWAADPPSAIMPTMAPDGGSDLDPATVVDAVVDHLRSSPPAWDPHRVR